MPRRSHRSKRRPLHFLTTHWRAIRDARRDFLPDRPAAVIGLMDSPACRSSPKRATRRHPVLLLEQNVIPGHNRWLARRHPICVTFDETCEHLPRKATPRHRQPLRKTSLRRPSPQGRGGSPHPPDLGGSHGSRQVNESASTPSRASSEQLATAHHPPDRPRRY